MGGDNPYEVHVVELDGAAVVHLAGEIDLNAHDAVLGVAGPLARDRPGQPLVLEMADVTFLDSSGIGCLVRLHNAAARADTVVRVRNPSPRVRKVLDLAGVGFLLEEELERPPAT